MPGLMSGDWKRGTVSGPQRLQPVRGQRRTYRLPRQPSTLTSATNGPAFYWQSPRSDSILLAHNKISQYHLDADPPRAAPADALLSAAAFDATVACWDAK